MIGKIFENSVILFATVVLFLGTVSTVNQSSFAVYDKQYSDYENEDYNQPYNNDPYPTDKKESIVNI
jgi:hypothetical protein